jgi:hypothetical protein
MVLNLFSKHHHQIQDETHGNKQNIQTNRQPKQQSYPKQTKPSNLLKNRKKKTEKEKEEEKLRSNMVDRILGLRIKNSTDTSYDLKRQEEMAKDIEKVLHEEARKMFHEKVHVYMHMYLRICIYVFVYKHLYIDIHTHIYMYRYTLLRNNYMNRQEYIYIYIYIYI